MPIKGIPAISPAQGFESEDLGFDSQPYDLWQIP